MRITIDVTKRDITTGDWETCPITRAVRRVLGIRRDSKLGRDLSVGYDTIYVMGDDFDDDIDLATVPVAVIEFTKAVNADRPVKPFSFVANFNQASAKRVGLTLPTE
ncbi:hypothetical protein LCGC14_2966320 [marine sediment metagenome]|uniref:Uncharacterized protein n=1 Tax=marine sediment metagenome TaxID=412755 RepID=A0A0F8XBM1_9ZZZZ